MNQPALKPTVAPKRPAFPYLVTANPLPHESNAIYRAQSLLTKGGKLGPVLPYNEALEVIRKHEAGEL